MKKSTFGKKCSRVGKILLASVLTVALLLCSVIPSMAEETTSETTVGYNTLNTHVYSPMDLIDGSTADTSNPKLKNDVYDSSMWKFAAKSQGENFFNDSDDIAAPDVEPVYGGVKISWESFDDGIYTVLVYGEDGNYTKKFTTIGTSVIVSDLTLDAIYSIQVAGETKASELAIYKNDRIATEVFRELPVLETGDYDMDATHRAPIMNNGEGNVNYFIQLDDAGKAALNANGAVIIEVKSNIDTTNEGYFEIANNTYQDKVYYNDCWIAMNSFIYPTGDDWKTVTTTKEDFYSDSGTNNFYIIGGTQNSISNVTVNGVAGVNYKSAYNFTNGYIVLPLDDFAAEDLSVNLIENTKTTGKLRLGNVVYNYYARYINKNGRGDTYGSAQSKLLDRTLSFPNVYIVSDYVAYVANHIDSEINTTSSYSENILMTNGAVVNNESIDDYIPFTANTLNSSYAFFCTTQAYTNVNNLYKQRTIEYTAADGEIMTFGFTAPQNGTYEIAAPLGVTATEGAIVKYAVIKTDALGNRTVLQAEQTYTDQERFCDILVELKTGETVWLESTGTSGTVIDIGIPQAIRLNDTSIATDSETGATTYTFRLLDYFENSNYSQIDYNVNSTTANTVGAWDFGYFKDTVTFDTVTDETGATSTAQTFTYDNIKLPVAVGDVADNSLADSFKSYELIRSGYAYNVLGLFGSKTSLVTKSGGEQGVMYPLLNYANRAEANASTINPSTTPYMYMDACVSGTVAVGNFFRFTSPVSGKANLTAATKSGILANLESRDVRMVVMVNNKVEQVAVTTATATIALEFDIKLGDEVIILYYDYSTASGTGKNVHGGCPQVTITGNYGSVSYDANGGEYSANNGQLLNAGTEIVLPTAVKKNAIFRGWSMGENTYQANETVTVNADMNLVALYDYYGDIDGDDLVAVSDLVKYQKVLLGVEKLEEIDNVIADINADETVNILDFIRMKKWLAGIAVSLGKA